MERDVEYAENIEEKLKKLVTKTYDMEYRLAHILYDHRREETDNDNLEGDDFDAKWHKEYILVK